MGTPPRQPNAFARLGRLAAALACGAFGVAAAGMAAASDQPSDHVVEPGETLSAISRTAGIPVADLVAINGIADPDAIVAGQVLHLSLATPRSTPTPVTYTVQDGDTLYSIAGRNGVPVESLVDLNELANPDLLVTGQQLRLGGTPPPVLSKVPMTATKATPTPTQTPSQSALPTPKLTPLPIDGSPGPAVRAPTPINTPVVDPPVHWLGTPNFWPGRPAGPPIALVLHTAAGTMDGMDQWFAAPASESSAHYGIGLDGRIHQYVRLEDRSWSNGVLEPVNLWPGPPTIQPNELTVNIETEDMGQDQMVVTDDQYAATLLVGQIIVKRFPSIRYLMTHRSLDPGIRANDPGPRWLDSGRFSALARDLQLIPIP